MATHDYVIANGTGAAVRSDLNGALAAIVSNNSNATAPATTYAYQWWADTATGLLKLRNSANSAWISLFQLDGEWSTLPIENGTFTAPSIYFKDSGTDTGIYSPGADQVGISTGGTARITVDGSGNVNIDSNTLYVDAANNRVGIGSSAPQVELNVAKTGGASTVYIESDAGNNATTSILRFGGASGRSASVQGFRGASSNVHSLDFYTYNTGDAFGMRLTATGLGIGTNNPGGTVDIKAAASTAPLIVQGPSTEFARIDSSGRLLVGTSNSRQVTIGESSGWDPRVQVTKTGTDGGNIAAYSWSTYNTSTGGGQGIGPDIVLARSNNNTEGTHTALTSAQLLGRITFNGSNGTSFASGAYIAATADDAWASGDCPTRLVFSTTADGAASPTERMRITSGGAAYIGQTTTDTPGFSNTTNGISFRGAVGDGFFSASSSSAGYFNRNTTDGSIVSLRQDGVEEGTISVSGTTVSYNGAHLSRWSQLPAGAERIEILRGTVLSNLDEMCEWGEEDNEQLNRMKVSDVEGDKNVSGVFQAWDDDDDTYTDDFYCAMTGDFIIRIAEGVTVERGDLLMSAGDGTAKPQDDDIIRSKTIAKVTSTNVSCTYEDGSYCVPCVLMAC